MINSEKDHKLPIKLLLDGYRLTTAEILYRMPDYPTFLQTFIWQDLDLNPEFPILKKFLNFWERELDGKLHSVLVCGSKIITPSDVKVADGFFTIQ